MKTDLPRVEEIVQELQILTFQVVVPCKHKMTSADLSTGTDVLVNNELNCSMKVLRFILLALTSLPSTHCM